MDGDCLGDKWVNLPEFMGMGEQSLNTGIRVTFHVCRRPQGFWWCGRQAAHKGTTILLRRAVSIIPMGVSLLQNLSWFG